MDAAQALASVVTLKSVREFFTPIRPAQFNAQLKTRIATGELPREQARHLYTVLGETARLEGEFYSRLRRFLTTGKGALVHGADAGWWGRWRSRGHREQLQRLSAGMREEVRQLQHQLQEVSAAFTAVNPSVELPRSAGADALFYWLVARFGVLDFLGALEGELGRERENRAAWRRAVRKKFGQLRAELDKNHRQIEEVVAEYREVLKYMEAKK